MYVRSFLFFVIISIMQFDHFVDKHQNAALCWCRIRDVLSYSKKSYSVKEKRVCYKMEKLIFNWLIDQLIPNLE